MQEQVFSSDQAAAHSQGRNSAPALSLDEYPLNYD